MTLQHTSFWRRRCRASAATLCTTLYSNAPHSTTLHHNAPHCNTLHDTATHLFLEAALPSLSRKTLQHTVAHWKTPHHAATRYTTQHHLAPHCTALQHTFFWRRCCSASTATHCNTMQHTEIHCNTLQHTATHCNTPLSGGGAAQPQPQHTATHCNILKYTAPPCNTLQHTSFWRRRCLASEAFALVSARRNFSSTSIAFFSASSRLFFSSICQISAAMSSN